MSSSRAAKKSKHPRVQAAPAAPLSGTPLSVTPLVVTPSGAAASLGAAASSDAAPLDAASSEAAPSEVMPLEVTAHAEGARPIEESLASEASGVVERPVVEGGDPVEAVVAVDEAAAADEAASVAIETTHVLEAAPVEAASVEATVEVAASVEAASVEATVEVAALEAAPVEATVEVAAPEAAPVEAPENVVANPDEEFVPSPVNYDEPGLFEVDVDEELYRFDAGKQGTAICLSKRLPNTWRWNFLGELRWDGRDLRSRALERQLLQKLSVELRTFAAESAE